ncbi:type I restriction enzyme R protein, partial [Helicobacter pylori]
PEKMIKTTNRLKKFKKAS